MSPWRSASRRGPFVDWLREHSTLLSTLDPHAALDDLEGLRQIVGDARVVAIGESTHFVQEFTRARERVLRFLAERCGFSIVAFEFGFTEAFAVDRWVQGEGAESELAQVSPTADAWGAGDLLRFVRQHNRTSGHPVRFAGIDLPEAGGSLRPALMPAAHYLRDVDPEVMPWLEASIRIASQLDGRSAAASAPIWARLEMAEQDALTAALSRLLQRFRALESLYVARSDQRQYDVARRQLEGAVTTDHMLRVMNGLFAGTGLSGDASARELYMAQSVLWHLEHVGPGSRIVLAAHNNHIQRTPVRFGDQLASLPMGQHLSRMLGNDYVPVAVTSTANHAPETYLDETAPVGFRVRDTPLGPPEAGSVEAAVLAAGLETALIDLRAAGRELSERQAPDRIRSQSAYVHTPLLQAFDGVLVVPTATIEPIVESR